LAVVLLPVLWVYRAGFRVFGLDAVQRQGGGFAFGFLYPGVAVVDGVLPVYRLDEGVVCHCPL